MKSILDYLTANGYDDINYYAELHGRITHIYATCGTYVICVVAPHSGNGFSYLLRANPAATHDRWSNCDYEESFSNPALLIEALRIKKFM